MDNRSAILGCALAQFSARGYDAVGVQEIVEAVGVTKPTLYHYFTSKRGLLEALLEEKFLPLSESIRNAAIYQNDLVMSLRKVMQAYFNFARQDPLFYRMTLTMFFAPLDSESNQAARRFQNEQYHLVEEMFIEAGKQHGNLKNRQAAYTATFIGLINTYIGLFLNGYLALDDSLVYMAVKQYMHGIFS